MNASTWEWRTFAEDFEPLRIALPPQFDAVDDTYILAPGSDTRARISANELLVDVLEDRRDGLELWRRSLTAAFPLCQHDVRDTLRQFRVPPPTLYRPEYTPFEFVTDVATCTNGVRVIGVRDLHRRLAVEGCTLERATFSIAGRTVQSMAFTGADPDAVRALIARCGLSRFDNINIVTLLKQVLGVAGGEGISGRRSDFARAG